MGTQLFTRKQTGEILGVKARTVLNYERKGLIKPAMYVSGRPRYTLESIQKIPTQTR